MELILGGFQTRTRGGVQCECLQVGRKRAADKETQSKQLQRRSDQSDDAQSAQMHCTCDQNRIGSRPSRLMSMTANIPPHPVANMSNRPTGIIWKNIPNRKILQLWCKFEKPRSRLMKTDSEHVLGSQVVDNARCCVVLCGIACIAWLCMAWQSCH